MYSLSGGGVNINVFSAIVSHCFGVDEVAVWGHQGIKMTDDKPDYQN